MLDRGKGFVHNARKILKRYPEAVRESYRNDESLGKKVFWILFAVFLYFPMMFLVVLFELSTGAPFEGGCGISEEELLEDLGFDRGLDEREAMRLAEIRRQKEEDEDGPK